MNKEIINYLLDCQSHSGLKVDIKTSYSFLILVSSIINFDEALNQSMIMYHKNYNKNKTWKSYDW